LSWYSNNLWCLIGVIEMTIQEWLKLYFATTNCTFDTSKRKTKFKFPLPKPVYSWEKND